jgi:type IV pilus assembly protein PilV
MNTVSSRVNQPQGQAGVGMIEVLIAVLVFSVGVLGMASVQLAAKKISHEAIQRSIATGLARDILERMRSNPQRLDSYVVNDVGSSALTAGDCVNKNCNSDELALYDLYDWSQLLQGDKEWVDIDGDGTTESTVGGLVASRGCIVNEAGNIWVAIAWKGASELMNPAPDAPVAITGCGSTSSLYGTGNTLRRLLVMATYIGGS